MNGLRPALLTGTLRGDPDDLYIVPLGILTLLMYD